MDINKHKFLMVQLLRDIFADADLSRNLAFKGGTAAMFMHGLPRFSTDLDFNLLDPENEVEVFEKVKSLVLRYGKIDDEAVKFYGPLIVLDYGIGERKLKIEISNRLYDNHYEVRNFLGISMRVMVIEDMFAHKLCALLDRREIASRDIFDCWFFLSKGTAVNKTIVETRMGEPLKE